jgi:hypothetical protein
LTIPGKLCLAACKRMVQGMRLVLIHTGWVLGTLWW